MSKKRVLALGILALGIALELVLAANIVSFDRAAGQQEPGKPSIRSGIGDPNSSKQKKNGAVSQLSATGTPVSTEDSKPGAESGEPGAPESAASAFDSGYPIQGDPDGDRALDAAREAGGYEAYDPFAGANAGSTFSYDDYPAPVYDDTDYGGYTDYPAPPTQPADPTETLPTGDLNPTEEPAQTTSPTIEQPTPDGTPSPAPALTQPTPTHTATATATVTPTATATATTTITPPGLTGAQSVLVSAPAQSAPELDGAGDDLAWDSAAPATILPGAGGPVRVQSVYTGEQVYFLLSWEDPAPGFLSSPWEYQPDGSWKRLDDAENTLALLWALQADPGAGAYDLWRWQAGSAAGQLDDHSLAGDLQADPSAGGGSRANQAQGAEAPAFMQPGGGARTGAPGYIAEDEKVPLDPGLFTAGERVPGFLAAPFTGDRGDVAAAWQYAGGRWTLEIRRKLVTGSPYDVQFADLTKSYLLRLAPLEDLQAPGSAAAGVAAFTFQP